MQACFSTMSTTFFLRLLLLLSLTIMASSAADDKTIALFASTSQVPTLLQWVRDNAGALDSSVLMAPASIVLMISLDSPWLNVEAISEGSAEGGDSGVEDIIVANQVLNEEVHGVVFFYDGADTSDYRFNVLTRACNKAQVPLAVNSETANLALRGIVKTKTAYLIFNPIAGQGDSKAQLELIQSMLGPRLILHVVMTQKDRECADQAREIVNMIKATPEYEAGDKESTIIIASGGDGTVSVCVSFSPVFFFFLSTFLLTDVCSFIGCCR
jgi:methylglyoxal synthase